MKKIFLDSNIWLRFFAHDNPQFDSVRNLISAIENGQYLPYASAIVLLEISYVLKTAYKQPKDKIDEYLKSVCEIRNITIIDKTNTKRALEILEKTGIKFSDCLIASQIKKGIILATFDRELSKIKNLNCQTPAKILTD